MAWARRGPQRFDDYGELTERRRIFGADRRILAARIRALQGSAHGARDGQTESSSSGTPEQSGSHHQNIPAIFVIAADVCLQGIIQGVKRRYESKCATIGRSQRMLIHAAQSIEAIDFA
jgi:hypothetical protein